MKVRLMSRKLEVSPSVVLLFLKDVMWLSVGIGQVTLKGRHLGGDTEVEKAVLR